MELIRERTDIRRLSIILPAYNCEAFLAQTLNSILFRLPEDYELIVIDDGSQDSTAEILKRYEGVRENLLIAYYDHAGASGARNHGLDLARGEYVAFLDCDDCLEEDFLEKSRPLLMEKAGLVIFGIERIYLAGNSEYWTVRDRVYDSASDFADDYIRRRQMLIYSNCNKFYCRRIIEDAHLRFEEGVSFGEDRLFNYDYLRLLDSADCCPAVITSSLVMLQYIQRDHLSQSSKWIPHYFHQAIHLHDAKKRCFFELSKGCTEEEKLDFEAYDLSQEVGRAIERFRLHPEERDENLPEINQLVFGGPYDTDAPIDVLVILGSRNCAYKAEAAFGVGKRNPGLRYIVSGANPVQDKSCSEAEFLFGYLRKKGVDASDIYLESRAHYTKQNLEFSSMIIRRLQEDGKLPGREDGRLRVGFLTGGFHIPRTKLLAEEILMGDDWEIRWFPAYGPHTRPESWFENPTGRDIILAELRKVHILKNEVRSTL